MVLNNFLCITVNKSLVSFANTTQGTSSIGGNITAIPNSSSAHYSESTVGKYVDIGFGTTLPTISDYKLADSNALDTPLLTFINSSETAVFPSLRTVTSIYRNDTESDVVVKEIGIVSKGSGVNNPNINCLLTRTVLDTPITVYVGETMAFTESVEIVN